MRDWEVIDSEDVPGDDAVIYLMNRGSEYVIHVDGRELMGNREHGSEAALADLACDRLDDPAGARVLVGGLGMGFTLAAVLRQLGPEGSVTVAELMPAVVRWNREIVGEAADHPLKDPRAQIHQGDVADLIDKPPAPWSAILLDVDNGPEALTRSYNGWLYTARGLRAARASLIPGGVLAVWSAAPDPAFTERLHAADFEVEVVSHHEPARLMSEDGGTHVLWMARR